MENLREKLTNIERQAKRIGEMRPAYGTMIAFYENLISAQIEFQAKVSIKIPVLPEDHVQTRIKEGFPLLNRSDFPIDTENSTEMMRKIGRFIPDENEDLRDSQKALLRILETNGEEEDFCKSILEGKDEGLKKWATRVAIPVEHIRFLGLASVRPSLLFVGEELSVLFPHDVPWRKPYCPVCGSLPALLCIKEKEGKRFGSCSWCGNLWQTNRIQCLYCQNQLQESLGYFTIENDEVYRVEYCDACKHYVKTIDCRSLEDEPTLSLEDLTTLHLDMIAQKKGYKPLPSLSPAVYSEFFEDA